MDRKRLIYFCLVFVCVFFVSTKSLIVYSKTSTDGITLSPARREVSIKPGTMRSGVLTITNNFDKSVDVELSAEEFNVINKNYDYVFTENSDIVKWVSFKESMVNLAPKESRSVEYYIGVPNNAEPGGKYLSLFVSTEIKDEGDIDNLISKQRVASLVYVNVEGEVSRVGNLILLNTPWLTTGTSNWSATVRNSGTTHYHSVYGVSVYDLFGNKKSELTNESLILPASIRLISGKLPQLFLPGIYKTTYEISLGDSPQIKKSSLIIYLPEWFILLILLVIGVLIIKKSIKTNQD